MPDYDVQAVALASPPASAPVTDYRPGIAVKNLGIHDADVTGFLNVYDRATGLMVATFALAAAGIAPGETRTASASTLWQPTEADVGKHFLFTGYITYPPDQNKANNQLGPTNVLVTAEEPPPPPPVEAHASQHEDGGADEITVEGLTGKLAEAQEPTDHAARHGAEGEDQLDVTGLTGLLATPQTPTAHAVSHGIGGSDPVTGIAPGDHATSHELGGGDLLNVGGLAGELADAQTPKSHGNEAHSSTFEDQANKDTANGYAGLDEVARVPTHHLNEVVAQAVPPDGTYCSGGTVNPGDTLTIYDELDAYAGSGTKRIMANFSVRGESPINDWFAFEAWAEFYNGTTTYSMLKVYGGSRGHPSDAEIVDFPVCVVASKKVATTGTVSIRVKVKNTGAASFEVIGGEVVRFNADAAP